MITILAVILFVSTAMLIGWLSCLKEKNEALEHAATWYSRMTESINAASILRERLMVADGHALDALAYMGGKHGCRKYAKRKMKEWYSRENEKAADTVKIGTLPYVSIIPYKATDGAVCARSEGVDQTTTTDGHTDCVLTDGKGA